MEKIIEKILYEECLKSLKCDDVPVGAVLVKNHKIISRGHNTREKRKSIIGHAEINCITKATKKLKTWHLNDCVLYVTLKPCSMCEGLINQSQIKEVIYYTDKDENKKEYYGTKYNKKSTEFSTTYADLLTAFFKNKRK